MNLYGSVHWVYFVKTMRKDFLHENIYCILSSVAGFFYEKYVRRIHKGDNRFR